MTFLDIVIHQSNEYLNSIPSDGFWWKLFFSVIGSLIGSIIGVGGSLYVFYRKTQQDKTKENADIQREDNDLLNYFSSLSANVSKSFLEQAEYISEFANQKKLHPYDPSNILALKVNRDIDRLQSLDQAKLFKAYYARFGNNQKSLNTITDLYSCLDFLYEIKGQLAKEIEVDHLTQIEMMTKFAEYSGVVSMESADVVGKGKNGKLPQTSEYNSFWREVSDFIVAHHGSMTNGVASIPQTKDVFIDPLRNRLVEMYSHLPESEVIIKACKKAGDKYKEIEIYQTGASEYLLRKKERVIEVVNRLKLIIPTVSFSN